MQISAEKFYIDYINGQEETTLLDGNVDTCVRLPVSNRCAMDEVNTVWIAYLQGLQNLMKQPYVWPHVYRMDAPRSVHIITSQFVITSKHQNLFPLLSCLFPFHPCYVFLHLFLLPPNFFLLFPFLYIIYFSAMLSRNPPTIPTMTQANQNYVSYVPQLSTQGFTMGQIWSYIYKIGP